MRVVVIGGTGHIGTYLVPRLAEAGHDVISISRQQQAPYQQRAAWKNVQQVAIDRTAAEKAGDFGKQIQELDPDIVVDLICFTPDSAHMLVEALQGRISHFLHCGTIWVHGHSTQVPTTESQARCPLDQYGINKNAIEKYLHTQTHQTGFPATILHPGHIVGAGWAPLNPAGHFNPEVFAKLAHEEKLALPNFGLETIHHVHADDVAQLFMLALSNWSNAVGESFHAVSPQALTLRGYAEAMAAWFGKSANLRFLPWDEWKKTVTEEESQATKDHITHSPNCSIVKAQRLLNYQPRYTSLQAVQKSVEWLIDHQGLLS
jgi:nucleoside-diphosphate-sugar epimerase